MLPEGNGNGDPDFSFQTAFSDAARQQASASTDPPADPPAPQEPPSPDPAPADPPAPEQPPQQPTQPQESAWLAAVREAGLEVDESADPAQVAQQIAENLRAAQGEVERLTPFAQYGQSLMPHAEQIREYFQQQQPQAEPETSEGKWTAEGYFKDLWQAPTWDEQYNVAIENGMVSRNPETGLFEAVRGYETMVTPLLAGMNQAQQWQAKQWQSITRSNPYQHFYEKLSPAIQHLVDERVDELVGQRLSQQKSETTVEQFERENSDWLFEGDQYSQQGKAFIAQVQELKKHGITDPQTLINYATRLVGRPTETKAAAAEPAAPATPQKQPEAKQDSFLKSALKRASHSPSAGAATVQAPDNPAPLEQSDLDRVFVSAFQAAQGSA